MGLFYFSAKAFDILEKLDGNSNAEYLEGKVRKWWLENKFIQLNWFNFFFQVSACCALFQLIIAEKESR